MVNEYVVKRYCNEDLSKIENCDKAMADKENTWHCHHREEIRTLPSGITVIRTHKELKENGRYYNCPANELIFLTASEHRRLHNNNRSAETHKKMSKSQKGRVFSEETRRKLSESHKGNTNMKGKPRSKETRNKLSLAFKGKSWKLVDGKRVWYSKEVE